MKKGIRGHDLKIWGIKEAAEKCKSIGLEYLQLVFEKTIPDFERGKFTEAYAEQIKKELGDIKIAVLGSYINPSDPDEDNLKAGLEAFKEKIRYASVLKPIVVGTETGTYIEGKTHTEEAYQYLLKNIKELVKEAEKYDVTVGIEGVHYFVINSPEMMKRLIDDVASENIKVIFDPCNLLNEENYLKQDEIINSMFDLLGDKIVAVHVKDFTIENGHFVGGVVPGKGLLNYELILNRLTPDVPMIGEGYDEFDIVRAYEYFEGLLS